MKSSNLLLLHCCASSSLSSSLCLIILYTLLSAHQQLLTRPAPSSHLAAPQTGRCPVPKLDKDLKFDEEMPAPWCHLDFYIQSTQSCIRNHFNPNPGASYWNYSLPCLNKCGSYNEYTHIQKCISHFVSSTFSSAACSIIPIVSFYLCTNCSAHAFLCNVFTMCAHMCVTIACER